MYNDIQMWKYSELPGVFGDSSFLSCHRATTEEELEQAMQAAIREEKKLVMIDACITGRDCSAGLERLGESFRRSQKK
jgi:TPP-dependent 2-oxoacid decarboxylase